MGRREGASWGAASLNFRYDSQAGAKLTALRGPPNSPGRGGGVGDDVPAASGGISNHKGGSKRRSAFLPCKVFKPATGTPITEEGVAGGGGGGGGGRGGGEKGEEGGAAATTSLISIARKSSEGGGGGGAAAASEEAVVGEILPEAVVGEILPGAPSPPESPQNTHFQGNALGSPFLMTDVESENVEEEDDSISGSLQRKRKARECGSAGSGEEDESTPEHLLAITVSAVSSTSMKDTVQTNPGAKCEFLRNNFVGTEEILLQMSSQQPKLEASSVCSIRGGGMGAFDLTNAQLECLKTSEWLNDDVINAYMSLLSLRSLLRCKKHSEWLADGAGNERNKTDQEVEEVGERGDAMSMPPIAGKDAAIEVLKKQVAAAKKKLFLASNAPSECVFFSSFFWKNLSMAEGGLNEVRRWYSKKVSSRVHAGFRV